MPESRQIATRHYAECGVRSDTVNADDRTVEIIWAAGAKVKRYSWDEGYYMEELSMDPSHIRLVRFQNGDMSLLDSHDSWSMEHRLGTVIGSSVRIEGGKAYATVRLSRSNPLAERIFQDLRDGHGFPVSVGYKVHRYEKIEGDKNHLPTLRAIDWEPMELSAVPVPADAGAHSRGDTTRVRVNSSTRKAGKMPRAKIAAPAIDPDDEDVQEVSAEERAAEEQRVEELEAIGTRLGVEDRIVRRHVKRGTSVAEFREALLERTYADRNRHQTVGHFDRDLDADVRSQVVTGIASLLGAKPGADDPTELVGRSVLEIGRHYLESAGANLRGMRDSQIASMLVQPGQRWMTRGGYHTTSDFPLLLTDGAQRAALERFQANPSVLLQFSRKRNQKDFRPTTFVRPGEAPDLLKVNEHGEIQSGTISLESESFKIESWGRMIGFTFQALVNDDLGALDDSINSFVDAGTNRVGDELHACLSENSYGGRKTRDGKNFFHADHGNKAASGGAIDVTTVGAAEEAMRGQKNVSGNGRAGMAPATLLVGPKRVVAARKFLAEIAAATTNDVNPYSGKLSLAVEDRYDGVGWWLFAGKPAFIHGFLEGYPEGPKIETQEGWRVLGTEWRAVMHFGANVYDYRAAYFNAGA